MKKSLRKTVEDAIMKKQKFKMKDDRVLKVSAPVVIVPDQKDKLVPVLTDRYFMDDIFRYFKENKVDLLDHWFLEGKICLAFESKEEAIIFKLKFPNYTSWREGATTVGEGFYEQDYKPNPFPERNC